MFNSSSYGTSEKTVSTAVGDATRTQSIETLPKELASMIAVYLSPSDMAQLASAP